MHSRTWSSRRDRKIAAISVLTVAIGALVGLLLMRLLPNDVASVVTNPKDQVSDRLGWFKWLTNVPIINSFLTAHPDVVPLVIGALLIGVPAARRLGPTLHDRLLASFNSDVLGPLGSGHADADGPAFVRLPWTLEPCARVSAWTALSDWVALSLEPIHSRLSVGFLVGRAGSGKTRLAVEFARDLCRRDVLGGTIPAASRRERMGFWWRSVVRPSERRRRDPWDAGFLLRRDGQPGEARYDALRKWLPRRSTFLILDDPDADTFSRTLAVLESSSPEYRHPVRLLIVNQTMPFSSELRCTGAEDGWTLHGEPVDASVQLSRNAWFDEKATRDTVFGTGLLTKQTVQMQAAARNTIYPLSEGNPLLIELALEWLLEHKSLEHVTPAMLSKRRAQRIVDGLRSAGVGARSQIGTIVLATLVGGAGRRELEQSASEVFPGLQELPPLSGLRQCFPADALVSSGGDTMVPPVKPKLVGDAFVDLALEHVLDGADAKPLIIAAYRLNPNAVLAAIARRGELGPRLGAAIDSLTTDDLSLRFPTDAALECIRFCCLVDFHDYDQGSAGPDAPLMPLAGRLIDACDPEALAFDLHRFVDVGRVDQDDRIVRGDAYADIMGRVMQRISEAAPGSLPATAMLQLVSALGAFVANLNRWGTRAPDGEYFPGAAVIEAFNILLMDKPYATSIGDDQTACSELIQWYSLIPELVLSCSQPASALRPDVFRLLSAKRPFYDEGDDSFFGRLGLYFDACHAVLVNNKEVLTSKLGRYKKSLAQDNDVTDDSIEHYRFLVLLTALSCSPSHETQSRQMLEDVKASGLIQDAENSALRAVVAANLALSMHRWHDFDLAVTEIETLVSQPGEVNDWVHRVICELFIRALSDECEGDLESVIALASRTWKIIGAATTLSRALALARFWNAVAVRGSALDNEERVDEAVERTRRHMDAQPGSRLAILCYRGCLNSRVRLSAKRGQLDLQPALGAMSALRNTWKPMFGRDPAFAEDIADALLCRATQAEQSHDPTSLRQIAEEIDKLSALAPDADQAWALRQAGAWACAANAASLVNCVSVTHCYRRFLETTTPLVPSAELARLKLLMQPMPFAVARQEFLLALSKGEKSVARAALERCGSAADIITSEYPGWSDQIGPQIAQWLQSSALMLDDDS